MGVVDILGTGCQKYGISAGFAAPDDVPKVFWLKPMTARFSVLKNVLSGRFNAWDDFWVVQVAKKPSQLVFVPSMAISQEDRMGIFVLNRLSHVSHLSDVGLTDFAIPFLGLR